jgi:hypothetical protein
MIAPRLVAPALMLLGVAGLSFGATIAPRAAFTAYLSGFAFALSVALGCLFIVSIAHATRARWMLLYRRFAELGAAATFVLLPAFVPLALDLSAPVAVRSLGYFAVWIVVSEVLLYFSRHQDPDLPSTSARLRIFGVASIWPIVLTATVASFDWFMSIEPGWVSSMYPVYYSSGALLAALAAIALAPRLVQRPVRQISGSHRHALGRLLHTFVIFWAYIAFCQFMLIWAADLPSEVPWYLVRMSEGWGALAVCVVFGQFVAPFFLLLSRQLKRRQSFLAGVGAWLLLMHWLDVVWTIGPPLVWWMHLAALSFFAGLLALVIEVRARGSSLLADGDPMFPESMRYRSR